MTNDILPGQKSGSKTKFRLTLGFATILSGMFGFVQGANKVVDAGRSYEYQLGTVMGAGLAAGLIIWLIAHFAVMKAASRSLKWITFFSVACASMLGAFLGWEIAPR